MLNLSVGVWSSLQLVTERVEPTEYQRSVMEKLDAAEGGAKEEVAKKKRKRPKGPNPLSVKKSSKMRPTGGRAKSSVGGVTRSKVGGLYTASGQRTLFIS